jgi:broad specificity phosphatase PhoE
MSLFLIRHAQAGSRARWNGTDDTQRPLTSHGRYQSADLVGMLVDLGIEEIRSSPYKRCIETAVPLAAAIGISVIVDERLAEGPHDEALAFARTIGQRNVALCSHGDIIPAVLDALVREDGLVLDKNSRCQKGSVWVLEPDLNRPGAYASALYLPPPH